MGTIKLIGSMLMMAVFVLAVVVFAIGFGNDNDSYVKLGDDEDFNSLSSAMQKSADDFRDDAKSSADTFFSTTQDQGDQSATSGGQFKIGITTAVSTVVSMLGIGFSKIFGSDTGFGIILTVFTSLLVMMASLYGWKAWKGNPD